MLYIWLNVEGKLEKEMWVLLYISWFRSHRLEVLLLYTMQHVSQRTCLSILLRHMLRNKLRSVKADFQSFHEAPRSLALWLDESAYICMHSQRGASCEDWKSALTCLATCLAIWFCCSANKNSLFAFIADCKTDKLHNVTSLSMQRLNTLILKMKPSGDKLHSVTAPLQYETGNSTGYRAS
jgi:hypothetical protein